MTMPERRTLYQKDLNYNLMSVFQCSCWCPPMEEQENFCKCAWWCYCIMGFLWVAWIPSNHSGVPFIDTLSGCLFPVVQCINLYQQVMFWCSCYFWQIWYLIEYYMVLTSLCSLIRSPPQIPKVQLSERTVLDLASALRIELNRAFHILRDIASGRDLKTFLGVSWSFFHSGAVCVGSC